MKQGNFEKSNDGVMIDMFSAHFLTGGIRYQQVSFSDLRGQKWRNLE